MNKRVLINGAMGHMGRALVASMEEEGWNMIPAVGVDLAVGEFPGALYSSALAVDVPFDVAIDFSRPDAVMAVLELCLRERKPIVIATTGLDATQKDHILNASRDIPVFYTRNMSLGVNLQLALARAATRILGPDFDPEIVETHHNLKVDAPSGTALMLAEGIESVRAGESELVFGRHEKNKRREKKEIGIHSLRGGTVVGEHAVHFLGPDEEFIIIHRAESKRVFAQGALKAATWLMDQAPGLYDMSDIVRI